MRFLFIGPGYPGVKGASHGSGIGTYLREITLGLMARGHECHVVVWGEEKAEGRIQNPESRIQNPKPQQPNNLTTQQLPLQDINGVKVFLLPHSYWPVIERVMPDSRDVWNMRQLVKRLDAEYHYDWIEIQSEEGIGIGVQRAFPEKTILRAHTTLLQMVEYKGEGGGDHRPLTIDQRHSTELCPMVKGKRSRVSSALAGWKLRYRLRRERRSFAMAKRIVTHSKAHAEEIKKLYPGIVEPAVVNHGIGAAGGGKENSPLRSSRASVQKSLSACVDLSSPTFLIIGSPDRRKGFDRIRPVLEAYAAKFGPCRCVIVGGLKVDRYWLMVNGGSEAVATTPSPFRGEGGGEGVSSRIAVEWKSGLSEEELANEYDNASVYLHLARYESFGVPLIEAAAHGVPIVSTRVGIAPELLEGELAACLVNGDDPEACAQVIGWAIQERARLRVRLLERHRESFTRDRMTQQYLGNLE